MSLTKTDILGISLFLILGSCVHDAKAETFIEIGQSNFQSPVSGLWWQEGYGVSMDLDSTFFRIGQEVGPWRFSYFHLGHYQIEALATQDEIEYGNGSCNTLTCTPPDLYITRGKVQGVLASYVLRAKSVYMEAGLGIFRQSFHLDACAVTERSQYHIYETQRYVYDETRNTLGYMLGVGVEYKRFTLSGQMYLNGDAAYKDGEFPSGVDTSVVMAVGYRF